MATDQIDYAAALRECGFDARGVARGLQMLESDRYMGFADVVSSLPLMGSDGIQRSQTVEAVVRRVASQEAAAKILRRGRDAAASVAVREAERAAARDEEWRRAQEATRVLLWVTEASTDQELEWRGPMRPEIKEAWERYFELSGKEPPVEFEPVTTYRPVDEAEPLLTAPPAAPVEETSTSVHRLVDIAESLQGAFGLGPETARRAAEGR